MSATRTKGSRDSRNNGRIRVGKACDRCRIKKSKCNGSQPCEKCKADDIICIYGERKRARDKIYPKGYVAMLERQQVQLVAGLRETYCRLIQASLWPEAALEETNGHPLTHDILARLDLLESKQDGSGHLETFEEDFEKLQQRLVTDDGSRVLGRELSNNGIRPEPQRGRQQLRCSESPTSTCGVSTPKVSSVITTSYPATDIATPVLSQQSGCINPAQLQIALPAWTSWPIHSNFSAEEDIFFHGASGFEPMAPSVLCSDFGFQDSSFQI